MSEQNLIVDEENKELNESVMDKSRNGLNLNPFLQIDFVDKVDSETGLRLNKNERYFFDFNSIVIWISQCQYTQIRIFVDC
jgi:hypothetical protein